jgi:8-oxo-dGTP diphosphatase
MKKYCYNYPKPSVTTDCIIIKNIGKPELLLIKRKHDPFQGSWALPGGFVEIDEDLEPGAKREIEEENRTA